MSEDKRYSAGIMPTVVGFPCSLREIDWTVLTDNHVRSKIGHILSIPY